MHRAGHDQELHRGCSALLSKLLGVCEHCGNKLLWPLDERFGVVGDLHGGGHACRRFYGEHLYVTVLSN